MKVSLYIPCFNAEKTIKICLDGVFKQTYPIEEVLIVDDGSTDATLKCILGYPVRIIRHESNMGLASTRNTAIHNLNSDFVASLDADCSPEPDWLRYLMSNFTSLEIAGVGGMLLEKNLSNRYSLWRSVHMQQHWGSQRIAPLFLFGANSVFCRETVLKVGVYNKHYRTNYEDVDLSQRLKKAGYLLFYEPKAIVTHQKSDDLTSLFNNYWNWNAEFYQQEGWYADKKTFIKKIKENIGLANRYLEEDMAKGRNELVYLDFFLALQYSLLDFRHFIFQQNQDELLLQGSSLLSAWLSLIDLDFFIHFNYDKKDITTLIGNKDMFIQNFMALSLNLFGFIKNTFNSETFQKILTKHLFLSMFKIKSEILIEKLFLLVELHPDWSDLYKKNQPNIDNIFLQNYAECFSSWVLDLEHRYPDVIEIIENGAEHLSFEHFS